MHFKCYHLMSRSTSTHPVLCVRDVVLCLRGFIFSAVFKDGLYIYIAVM